MDADLARWLATLPPDWVSDVSPTAFATAKAAYGTPGRHYHTWGHVLACVEELRTFPDASRATLLALVFHDAVYIPGSPDNERLSAALARNVLSQHARMPAGELASVERMILATTDHDAAALVEAERAMVDIDLAALAAPQEDYDRFVAQIRREFVPASMSDAAFRLGRADFLGAMLARPRIYATAEGRSRWEDRARANLLRELGALEARRKGVLAFLARLVGR